MAKRKKRFADDGWAVWVDGDDTSTVYINDWINPKGKSYVDIAVRIREVQNGRALHVYVPFKIERSDIEDVSLKFCSKNVLRAVFSASCIIDFKKNEHTSEIAYNGKTIDIVHISTLEYELDGLGGGTLLSVDINALRSFLDNDEAYFIWRMPHKSLNDVFGSQIDIGNALERLRDLITTPVVSEKYGYSVRINEARLLPEDINRIGAFHRQKLKKAVVSISVDEKYEINDSGCYRICRMESELYREYLPQDYKCEDVIIYNWSQNRNYNFRGHFNFYFNLTRESVSQGSMVVYLVLLMLLSVAGEVVYNLITMFIGLFR